MKDKIQGEVLSRKADFSRVNMCAPPSNDCLTGYSRLNERISLWVLKKGSLTVEAALIIPFFLTILLAFFSFFSQYAIAADLKVQAAAEAKKLGIVLGCSENENSGEVGIYKFKKSENVLNRSFFIEEKIVQKAVCRAWIGFTELDEQETYVYTTPYGTVYHLNDDCTHLNLSIKKVLLVTAYEEKNIYGERYQRCERCKEPFGTLVYITQEGNRYHSQRDCSGLKRTVQQVPLSKVQGMNCCVRCMTKEGRDDE